MPEGTIICLMFGLVFSGAIGAVVYCLHLARKYARVESDRQCCYNGTIHKVLAVVYDSNDWFMRRVRLQTDVYPYVLEVLIADIRIIPR